MQQPSDGRLQAVFHKMCQLENDIFESSLALQNNYYQKNFLESDYINKLQGVIEDYKGKINKINTESNDEVQSLYSHFNDLVEHQSKQFSDFLSDEKEILNLFSKRFLSELSDYNIIARQCWHNVETAMNALNFQAKDVQNTIYNEIKRLDILLVQQKKEYTIDTENKINQLQEKANKTVKFLTEMHLNKQTTAQKDFLKTLLKIQKVL